MTRHIICGCGATIDNPEIYSKCKSCRKIAYRDAQRYVAKNYHAAGKKVTEDDTNKRAK